LQVLRRERVVAEHRAELQAALADHSNVVVAAAAEMIAERRLDDLGPDLAAACQRLLAEPADRDVLCRAKLALTQALNQIEYPHPEVFRAEVGYVQMEPRWGGQDDTAAALRGEAALGLVRLNDPQVLLHLADLLADPEKVARSAAARCLGGSGLLGALPLLRFKAHIGDPEPDVMAECLTALMTMAPAESVPFVARFLDHASEEVAMGAALALGESRRLDALALLTASWPRARRGPLQEVVLLAIALTRLPTGIDFVLEVLAEGDPSEATAALSALAIHRHNQAVRARIEGLVTKRGLEILQEGFRRKFMAKD
jgi:hypothetical protein